MPKAKSKLKLSYHEELKLREKILKHVSEIFRRPHGGVSPFSSLSSLWSSSSISRHSSTRTSAPPPPPPPPFKPDQSVLLVGEGNFSFAHTLAENILKTGDSIIATTLDSERILKRKYDDAHEHISALIQKGGKVMYNVDATQLDKCKELKNKRFDKIVFNFPHAGAGIKDQDRNILENQKLVKAFLISCIPFLSSRRHYSDKYDGEIFLSLKSGLPYDNWNIKNIIKSIGNLVIRATNPFIPSQYPGYQHRRTLGFQEGISKGDNEEISDKKAKILLIGKKNDPKKSKKRR